MVVIGAGEKGLHKGNKVIVIRVIVIRVIVDLGL
jgi:hypothetical protein